MIRINKLKLALADYTFGSLQFDQSLHLIKLLGFDQVDLGLNEIEDNLHLVTGEELRDPVENGKRVRERAEKAGLSISDVFMQRGSFMDTALNHPDPVIREESSQAFKATVQYALACGCSHISIVPGCIFNDDYSGSLKLASEELKWRCDYAAQHNISTGIEAHVESIVETPQRALALIQMTPGLTLTLDHSHFIRLGATQDEVDQLLPYTSHMHIRNTAKGFLQTIFEESELDYEKLVSRMKACNYSGTVAIEFCSIVWENLNRIDTIGETMKLRKCLEKHWYHT